MLRKAIEVIITGYTLLTIGWAILSYFNLMPYYQVKLFRVDSISPRINLFPGQKIRLDLDFYEASFKEDIKTVKWNLSKDGQVFETSGLTPTIQLPGGGIYHINVTVTNSNNKQKYGSTNFYVVQDEPEIIKLPSPTKIDLSEQNTNPTLLNAIKNKGAEIYIGKNNWVPAKSISASSNVESLEFEEGSFIPTFDNQLLFRAKDAGKQLNEYGAVPVSTNSNNLKNEK